MRELLEDMRGMRRAFGGHERDEEAFGGHERNEGAFGGHERDEGAFGRHEGAFGGHERNEGAFGGHERDDEAFGGHERNEGAFGGHEVRISSQVGVMVTKGVNATEVSEHIQSWLGWVTSNLRSGTHQESISLDLFEQTCFRVECAKPYVVTVVHTRYDLWLIGCLVLGLLLFFYADYLSRSASFLYTSGVLLGVLASLLVIIFVLSRLLPAKRKVFFMIVASGWSMAVFMMQRVYRNLGTILSQHWQIVIGYFVSVGCISFAVCYRHGPLRDERSIQLLSWALQLVSLSLIYLSMQIPKFSLTVVIIVVSMKFIDLPRAGLSWLYRRQRSVALPKLLSEEEYQRQAKVETRRALEDLRCSCRSPEVDSWETASRLSSLSRFANFVEGTEHVTPEELLAHRQEFQMQALTDEDWYESFYEEEEDALDTSMMEESSNRNGLPLY
uniref:nuclear envelope integral membrane protein 1-like n=1 Tax=Myxine glutinosa TaxID=7769 RepID=UPI00358F8B44